MPTIVKDHAFTSIGRQNGGGAGEDEDPGLHFL
jgi:hypothetical protein